jgi:hypothetical protein
MDTHQVRVPVPLCPPKIPHRLAWVQRGPLQWIGPGYMKIGQYYLTRNVMIYTGHLLSLKVEILYHGQSVNHWLLIAETCVHSQGRPCGIYGRQNGTEIGCTPSILAFPCQYSHSTSVSYSSTCQPGVGLRPQ